MSDKPTAEGTILGRWAEWMAPGAIGLAALAFWEAATRISETPSYVLPGPLLIGQTIVADWALLSSSLWFTLTVALKALALAVVGGGALAIAFSQSRWLERALYPYAIVLQVTPVVAIAPLIIIWTDNNIPLALLICAWLVAFFPILSGMILGLRSADHNLVDLFQLYGASRWQVLRYLKLPAALPYFLGGLRISSGLALIGAVVAEFVAGSGGAESGLAFRILESGYQLKIPRMFAALTLIALTGVFLFALAEAISRQALRHWHESAITREG